MITVIFHCRSFSIVTFSSMTMNCNERKRQLNAELSVLPTFVPIQDCRIIRLDHRVPSFDLYNLIQRANITNSYTIDTEKDFVTHQPALFQIEFIGTESLVVVVQVCHLPPVGSSLLWMMQALFKTILTSSNKFYAWGNVKLELADFVPCGLFSCQLLDQISDSTDVQKQFKGWYNRTFTHECGLPSSVVNDHAVCTCPHRPMKQQNEPWSLQRTVAWTFSEFLDKTRTKSRWAQVVNHQHGIRRSDLVTQQRKSFFDHLVLYAIDDCLSVTKLSMVIESEWSKTQLRQYNQQQHPSCC